MHQDDRRFRHSTRGDQTVPKLCGADVELSNFILGVTRRDGTGAEAARALLREIEGVPRADPYGLLLQPDGDCAAAGASPMTGGPGYDPQDWGRKYLAENGGCFYIDLDHFEGCIPEVLSAFDHVAAWHALLRIARRTLQQANTRLPTGQKLQVLANNSDGQSHSYGSHLNFLMTRRAWDNLFHRKLQYQLFLAAFQASSIIITGQGKVGAENGAPAVPYQLSQRADFFETLAGAQTTYNRPIVNSRDEPLCGAGAARSGGRDEFARLHCIFYDSTLCHVSSLLKVGMMQVILAMIEAEEVNLRLLLDDPVAAVHRWSHDPTMRTRSGMLSGSSMTAVELQRLFLEGAKRFVTAGGCDGIVPRAGDIVSLWDDTLVKLEAGDLPALAGRLDWVLKLQTLERVRRRRPELTWDAPALKVLDHLYSSIDTDGLYWVYERSGAVERLVSNDRIDQLVHQPPEDTRAWTRAMLLRCAGADGIAAIDWDTIVFRSGWAAHQPLYRRLDLANPLAFTRAQTEAIFTDATHIDQLLDALGGAPAAPLKASTPHVIPTTDA